MKKRFFTLITMMVGLVWLFAACSQSNGGAGSIAGSGPMVTRDFEVSSFDAINITGGYGIVWRESTDVSVTVAIQENLLEHLDISVRNGTLYVEPQRSFSTTGDNTPRIYINTPYLTGISISGAATASGWDTIQAESFSVEAWGSADLALNFDVESLDIRADGAVYLDFTGNVSTANIVLNGTGRINIAVADYLDVELNGVGSVRYTGNPTVTRNISGIGTVQQAE